MMMQTTKANCKLKAELMQLNELIKNDIEQYTIDLHSQRKSGVVGLLYGRQGSV